MKLKKYDKLKMGKMERIANFFSIFIIDPITFCVVMRTVFLKISYFKFYRLI